MTPAVASAVGVCCHHWWASRIETGTGPARHLCDLAAGHGDRHRCSCGALRPI